jgi:hypothetical protein
MQSEDSQIHVREHLCMRRGSRREIERILSGFRHTSRRLAERTPCYEGSCQKFFAPRFLGQSRRRCLSQGLELLRRDARFR